MNKSHSILGVLCVVLLFQCKNPHLLLTTEGDMLYQYMENPVSFDFQQLPCSTVHVSTKDGRVYGSGCNYTVVPMNDDKATILVKVENSAGKTTNKKFTFKVVSTDRPESSLAGKLSSDSTVSKGGLASASGIATRYKDLPVNQRPRVSSFDISITTPNGVQMDFLCYDASFSNEVINTIKKITRGSYIHVTNIKCPGPNGLNWLLEPIRLKVV